MLLIIIILQTGSIQSQKTFFGTAIDYRWK
jgi:hypothetical protein